MDKFAEIQNFVKVVEAGSITLAAERLDVGKSVVSRRLADLESRLGVQLFQRTTRKLNLTESGRSFYEHCQRVLADLEEAELAVAHEHASLSGKLRVTVPLSFGLHHIAPLIREFSSLHPNIEFDLDFNDRQVDLIQEGFDIAIRIAKLADSSLIARRLTVIRHIACASPGYLAEHGEPKKPEALTKHVGLGYSNIANPGLWSFMTPDGVTKSVRIPIKLLANNGNFLCQMAVAGHGILLHPTFYVADLIKRGELIPLLPQCHWPELHAYAVYPATRHLSTRVRAFVDFLADHLADEPPWDRQIKPLLHKSAKTAIKKKGT